MRVAFTSTSGEIIDQHFGKAGHFWVWEIGPDTAAPVGRVEALVGARDEEDQTTARASAISGCAIVYTQQIGGPAAAKLVARRIHPMKTQVEVPVTEVVEKLQVVLRGHPPPGSARRWARRPRRRPQRTEVTPPQHRAQEAQRTCPTSPGSPAGRRSGRRST
jgi:nitrogen fixation protein NifX